MLQLYESLTVCRSVHCACMSVSSVACHARKQPCCVCCAVHGAGVWDICRMVLLCSCAILHLYRILFSGSKSAVCQAFGAVQDHPAAAHHACCFKGPREASGLWSVQHTMLCNMHATPQVSPVYLTWELWTSLCKLSLRAYCLCMYMCASASWPCCFSLPYKPSRNTAHWSTNHKLESFMLTIWKQYCSEKECARWPY